VLLSRSMQVRDRSSNSPPGTHTSPIQNTQYNGAALQVQAGAGQEQQQSPRDKHLTYTGYTVKWCCSPGPSTVGAVHYCETAEKVIEQPYAGSKAVFDPWGHVLIRWSQSGSSSFSARKVPVLCAKFSSKNYFFHQFWRISGYNKAQSPLINF